VDRRNGTHPDHKHRAEESIPESTLLYLHNRGTSLARRDGYGGGFIWNFAVDPYGALITPPAFTATADTGNIISHVNSGDHSASAIDGRIHYGGPPSASSLYTYSCKTFNTNSVCYSYQSGKTLNDLNKWPVDRTFALWPMFAGKSVTSFGSGSYQSHPRRWQTQGTISDRLKNYFTDVRGLLGNNGCTTSSIPETGTTSVYKVSNCGTLNRKHIGTLAISGDRILRDISSVATGNQIKDSTPWSYCIVIVGDGTGGSPDECRNGAVAGDIYASVPLKNQTTCLAAPTNYPGSQFDVCIGDQGPYTIGPVQWSMEKESIRGVRARVLTYFDQRPHVQNNYSIMESFADGSMAIHLGEDHGATRMYVVKIPPMPEESSNNPLTFERVRASFHHPAAATFRLEFGYAEHGSPTQYYCTSRREACSVDAATLNQANPFKWASESPGAISCSSGRCQAEIPRLPGRIVFSRARFYDSGGTLLETKVLPPM
jgi:hypothetical protein